MRIFGVILAGGEGRRMGGADKALLPFAGRRLLDHVQDRFAPQVEALALSANGDAARFDGRGLPVLPDDRRLGPLSGVLAGLRWAAGHGTQAIVTVPVDAPFLPCDLVPRLTLAAETSRSGLAVAQCGRRLHPTFGLWPVALIAPLAGFLASGVNPKVMDFAAAHDAAAADFADDGAFANLNSPEDLTRAEAALAKGAL